MAENKNNNSDNGTNVPPNNTGDIQAASPAEKEAPKSTKVEVEADVLNRLLEWVQDLETKMSEYEKTASQDQIRKIEALRAQGKLVKSVRVHKHENQHVLGWKITRDDVWVDSNGKLNEFQEVELFLEDGKTAKMSLLQFTRSTQSQSYEVIKEAKTALGDIEFTVDVGGGKELTILGKFVN